MSQPPPDVPAGSPAIPPEPPPSPSSPPATTPGAPSGLAGGWNPLPQRAFPLYVLGELPSAVLLALPTGVAGLLLGHFLDSRLMGAFAGGALGFGFGLWIAIRRFRTIHWRLDAQGLAVRSGRLWQQETRVPLTRVQHLDLTRGPLQRHLQLATLVIHTAGSRHGAVSVPDLDLQDAEQLRDQLGRQLDDDRDGDD